MNDFFTWQMLTTYAGALLATLAFTQLFEGVCFVSKLPPRILSYIVALLVLIAATLLTDGFSLDRLLLCFFNAMVVSLAGNGAYDGLTAEKHTDA